MNKKHIIMIDLIVVVGTLVIIAGFVGYSRPLVISPLDDLITSDTSVLFSFQKADVILIDDNRDFTSPAKYQAENNLVINLRPGIYFWKVEGTLASFTRKLTIESEVDLMLKDDGENYRVVNSGNTKLSVDIFENGTLTGNVIIDVDEEEKVDGNKFIGDQHD
jgi:hypothetical protein